MAIGFRKSLFGFNTADVMGYIEAAQRSSAVKLNAAEAERDELKKELDELNGRLSELTAENTELTEKLNQYTEKYEEINRLSENIGKLYLVAQANAQAIMKNSADISEKAAAEAERNLSSIAEAQQSLSVIKQELLDTTSHFSGRVSELIASLDDTREKISEVNTSSEQHTADFNTVYESLSK